MASKRGRAPAVNRLTESVLREMYERGRHNPFYFARVLWGDKDIEFDPHARFFDLLSAPQRFRLLCAARGTLKSSCVLAGMAHRGLYDDVNDEEDFSFLLVMNRDENAKVFNEKFQRKFLVGPQAGLLQHLFWHRLDNFKGWNSQRTVLARRDPNAPDYFTFAGLESSLESMHKRCIWGDDLEGSDADISDAPNESSFRFVIERAKYLLKYPTDPIIINGTPHGEKPLVWRLRRMAEKVPKMWAVCWAPIRDEDSGRALWATRFPEEWIDQEDELAAADPSYKRSVDMQLYLRERTSAGKMWDMDRLARMQYELVGEMIRYPKLSWSKPTAETGWDLVPKVSWGLINLAHCNLYLHLDPVHKDPDERSAKSHSDRPSRWGLLVVAVSPDLHQFPVEEWSPENANFHEAVEKFFALYRKWAPRQWTYDDIGAQSWIVKHLEMLERTKYSRGITSYPMPHMPNPVRLPRPSTRGVASEKKVRDKEKFIVDQLELPHYAGFLHLNSRRTPILWSQHEDFGVTRGAVDLLDALAQGPQVWAAPPSLEQRRQWKWLEHVQQVLSERGVYDRTATEPLPENVRIA